MYMYNIRNLLRAFLFSSKIKWFANFSNDAFPMYFEII